MAIGGLGRGLLAALVTAILGSACTSGDGILPTGRVAVGIVYRGGPAPGTSNALHGGSIRIIASDGTVVAVEHIKDGQSPSSSLAPGTYRFEAKSGDAFCRPREATVRAGTNGRVLVSCDVK